MKDVMLDLETMGNGPNAAIVTIGAVEFDPATDETGDIFGGSITLESAMQTGGEVDASTVVWWMEQSDAARSGAVKGKEHITAALHRFSVWLDARCDEGASSVLVWGNGATFDNVILANAYRRLGMPIPWKFWNDRCYRTVKAMHSDIKLDRIGTHHNAIDDAISQACHLMTILQLNGREPA